MPEYLAPGVYVEETSFRQKTIEGVSTSTTGFVGPTRFGPVDGDPPLVTSFTEFERIYGGIDRLRFGRGRETENYVAHAVRAYFDEGGKRLYVSRIFHPPVTLDEPEADFQTGRWEDGVARWPRHDASPVPAFALRARYPGAAGNFSVTFFFKHSENILMDGVRPTLQGAFAGDVVWAQTNHDLSESPPNPGRMYWIDRYFDEDEQRHTFRLRRDNPDNDPPASVSLDEIATARVLTVNVVVESMGRFGEELSWEDLSFHPGVRNALGEVFSEPARNRSTELFVPLIFETDLQNGAAIAEALLAQQNIERQHTVFDALVNDTASDAAQAFRVPLEGGDDGRRLVPDHYRGKEDDPKSGLWALAGLEDISIVAAPGSSHSAQTGGQRDIVNHLIQHCELMRYRVAVLDSGNAQTPGEVRQMRNRIDSTRAALYYPWVTVRDPLDPLAQREIQLPPSGFVTGIYARNDIERGVHKAPANEVVRGALSFERLLNRAQQDVLNPLGINCLRFFEGRGFRVWGARTASSDPEWKYLNVRRYFAFLERSIEKGTQFAVFEPNGPVLWANVRATIEDFLFNEWSSNHLLGTKPDEAYFVRCDRTTMTQNDLDNGRMICLIGVAPLRPAEFVIFRIGQKTADAR